MDDKKQILIVEDDLDLVEMLSAYFKVQGYEIRTASWGEDAVQSALDQVPDLILQDIRLPDIDGFEVVRRLRAVRKTQHVPVIFLTEKRERKDRLAGLQLGAVDYITKPFDVQELRLRVRNVLRRKTFRSMVNPVTNLPEGVVVQERLNQVLQGDDWGIVLAGLQGLSHFRDQYGFVASDDVARAVSLMLSKTVKDGDEDKNFIGHIDAADFLIITSATKASTLARKCEMRLKPSLPYFYPAIDREKMESRPEHEKLSFMVSSVSSDQGKISSLDDLRAMLS